MKKEVKKIRLQKFLASYGFGSRRGLEKLIVEGKIKINGKVAQLGDSVLGTEKISLDGKVLQFSQRKNEFKREVLIYNKRVGELCSRSDPEGRATVFQNLPKLKNSRWVMVGRLDLNSSGLLLFTNDGALANKLMHPSCEIEREYWVRVAGKIDEYILEKLKRGIKLEDGLASFSEIIPLKANLEDEEFNKYVSVIIKEGKKREVRRLFEAVGCQVSRLKRVRYGSVILPRYLPAGKWQYLEDSEVKKLLNLIYKPKIEINKNENSK